MNPNSPNDQDQSMWGAQQPVNNGSNMVPPSPSQNLQPQGQAGDGPIVPGGQVIDDNFAVQAAANFGRPVAPPVNQMPNPSQTYNQPNQPLVTTRNRMPLWGWIVLATLALALIGGLVFGYWAYSERQDYKNNSDQKVAEAVVVAEKETTEKNNLRYAEESKNPLKTFTSPAEYGNVKITYPKTWSAYVISGAKSKTPFTAYFHPDVVPSVASSRDRQSIALKVELIDNEYDRVIKQRQSKVKSGKVKASPYAFPKMSKQIGSRFSGQISTNFSGNEYIVPLRDKTLVLTTETDLNKADIGKYVLPNLTFSP